MPAQYKTPRLKYAAWLVMALPAVWIIGRFAADIITYGGAVHETGLWSAGFLVAALAVTPLRRAIAKSGLAKFAAYHRRALGVASFGYAALHTGIYLWRKIPLGRVISEGQRPDLLLGWLALAIFIPLAVTSHNRAVKAMGARWSALHRSVYIAAALTFAHAILSSGRPALSYSLLAVWLAAIAARMLFKKRG